MRFSEKQMRAMTWWLPGSPDCSRDALICDGAVRSGKTLCMGLGFVCWAMADFTGKSFALCGKTVRSLKRNLVTTLLPALSAAGFACSFQSGESLLRVKAGGRQNRFYLFGGRDAASAALIQGITLAGVLFDEAALMPRDFVQQALARCSVEGSRFWFNCNPEGPQHWFYTEWIRKTEDKNALYLHFTMEDNPGLSEKMRGRYQNLYTGVFYERYILGRWVAAEGLIYPFMTEKMAADVPLSCSSYAVSCDYGTQNPSSFGLWGKSGACWYRVAEYYYDGRRNGPRTDEEHYRALEKLCRGKKIDRVVADPSAASFIETIRRHGQFPVAPAKNDVLQGIRRTGLALKEGRVRICRGCRDTWREFSLYRWQQTREAPVKENDHAMDDIRYFVSTILAPSGGFAAAAVRRPEKEDKT
ncbi:MAG: PBSX family phage terminase large subunit [Oscillospiraceae bacterium]|jgi:PBSX family phage terminase large subunit|nr:PBSX family phage terminase large subunit [Oscillospiraceae bacterium]MDD3260445.1 PBSX family phage terminase large subunit [Oscillospiraceae bacterium]